MAKHTVDLTEAEETALQDFIAKGDLTEEEVFGVYAKTVFSENFQETVHKKCIEKVLNMTVKEKLAFLGKV